jgi:hypothetical protein
MFPRTIRSKRTLTDVTVAVVLVKLVVVVDTVVDETLVVV